MLACRHLDGAMKKKCNIYLNITPVKEIILAKLNCVILFETKVSCVCHSYIVSLTHQTLRVR